MSANLLRLRRWRNGVFALFFINGLVSATWASRLPAVKVDTQSNLQELSTALLGAGAGVVAGLSFGLLLTQRIGARRSLGLAFSGTFAGLALVGIGSTVFGSLWIVAIGAFVWGLFLGAADVVSNIEGAANEQETGKSVMPLMHAFFSVGTVVGALGGSAASAAGWTVLLNDGLAIALGIAALGWALPRLPEAVGSDATTEAVPLRKRLAEALSAWRDPAALLIGVGALANGFAEGGANDWMAIAAVEGHGLTQAGAALLYGAFVGGMTILRFVGGFIVDRWGRVWAIRVSAASAVLGIGLFVWTTGPLLAVVGCVLWGAGVSLGFPLAFSAAGDHPNGPARMSMVSTVGYGAFLMGPPLIGFLGQKIGIMAALSLLLVLLVIAAFVAPAARERAKERVIAS